MTLPSWISRTAKHKQQCLLLLLLTSIPILSGCCERPRDNQALSRDNITLVIKHGNETATRFLVNGQLKLDTSSLLRSRCDVAAKKGSVTVNCGDEILAVRSISDSRAKFSPRKR